MANLAKFRGGMETARMMQHWERATDESGEYVTYPRKEGGGHIHHERTDKNYTIGEIHDEAWIKARLKGVYQKPNQKRPIQTCDIVVTLPRSEPLCHTKQFMIAAYHSLMRQYGKNNNVIGCYVHLDEAQPHLHFAFLPIADRHSKQLPQYTEKLAVSAYWGKKNALQMMHKTLQKDIDAEMGHHVDVTFADSKDRDEYNRMTQAELKARTEEQRKKLKAATDAADAAKAAVDALEDSHLETVLRHVEHKEAGVFQKEHVRMSEHEFKTISDAARAASMSKRMAEDEKARADAADARAEREIAEVHRLADERVAEARAERDEARADADAAENAARKAQEEADALVMSADDRAYQRVRREADEARTNAETERERARTAEERADARAKREIEQAKKQMQKFVDEADARADAAEAERDEVKRSAPAYFDVPEKFRGYADEGIKEAAKWWVSDVQDLFRHAAYAYFGAKKHGGITADCLDAAEKVLKANKNILPEAQLKRGCRLLASDCYRSCCGQAQKNIERQPTPHVNGNGGAGWGCSISPDTVDYSKRPMTGGDGGAIGGAVRAALGSEDDIDLSDPTISQMTREEKLFEEFLRSL